MGTMTSVTIIGISLIIIAVAVWLLERKYNKSYVQLKATTDRVTVLESTVSTQGNAIAAATTKIDVVSSDQTKDRIKIGDLEASKLPLRDTNPPKQVTLPSTPQVDPAVTLLTTAAVVSTFDSTPSYSSGSCSSSSSSDSGSYDSSSSCSSSSDSY
ncbi:hypothetical protein vBAbaPP1_22 [Acinetobacter phage vB_AbaM_P1]|nr:hypothetical protein vBAbaPP1_22 [Acinetobacter phage vB_AbaM_P1]WAX22679.1 hypothetical protein [Acinetobacter phage vB_AbaP_HB01]